MTRGTWLLLAIIGLAVLVLGGAMVGSGHEIVGVILILIGAPTMGMSIGRYRSTGSPLK